MNRFIALAILAAVFSGAQTPRPRVRVTEAPFYRFPGVSRLDKKNAIDCNSPAHWDGDTFYLFNSYAQPARGSGKGLLDVKQMTLNRLDGDIDGKRLDSLYIWLESTYRAPDGTLYGWYHYEPDDVCKPNAHLPTAPRIGALRSRDNGAHWEHLGVVIDPPPDSVRCDTASPWDSGGHGDFSVIADPYNEYLYFFFSSYVKQFAEQGVGVARMRVADRDRPAGKVSKWHRGKWTEPGIGGRLTPVWPARRDWHVEADLFWGPSIHWNTHLGTYVILMNRAVNSSMKGDGTYVSFNRDLSNPRGWSEPEQILTAEQAFAATEGSHPGNARNYAWYPQVIGTGRGESDKLAGRSARLFIAGVSRREIVFLKPGERE